MLKRTRGKSAFRKEAAVGIFRNMAKPSPELSLGLPYPGTDSQVVRTTPMVHTVAGLFAGIGGIELGLHRAGHRTNLLCEIEPSAIAVLAEHFPEIPIWKDVNTLEQLPEETSLVAAGFPCQDLSQAGRTAGIRGKNSGLVNQIFRLLERQRVPWVLLENVSFMLRLARGKAFLHVIEALEELGYRWAYRIVDSRAFGVPQRRQRVYLLAAQPEAGDPRAVLFSDDAGELDVPTDYRNRACGFYWTEGIRGLGWAVDAIPTLKGGSTIGISSPPGIWMPDGRVVVPDIRDGERFQGFTVDWTKAAAGRVGVRWKLIGNAVTVDAAEWIGVRMADPGEYDARLDEPIRPGQRWPNAAWCLEMGVRFASSVSPLPMHVPAEPLAQFLRFEPRPLSARATAGFFSRTQVSSLRFPEGFLAAIESHLRLVSGEPTPA